MRLRAAAGALFPLAGEEKKSKSEAERHRLHSVALTARARQRPQRALKLRPPAVPRPGQRRRPALADHPPAPRQEHAASQHGSGPVRSLGASSRQSAHCEHLDRLRRSTAARAKRVSQTQPRGAAAPRETGGRVRPKHWPVHRCRDRPRRLGDYHASAIDRARVMTGGGDALGERRGV
jgi:hypothetical protein